MAQVVVPESDWLMYDWQPSGIVVDGIAMAVTGCGGCDQVAVITEDGRELPIRGVWSHRGRGRDRGRRGGAVMGRHAAGISRAGSTAGVSRIGWLLPRGRSGAASERGGSSPDGRGPVGRARFYSYRTEIRPC
jgi:hypothetical protein